MRLFTSDEVAKLMAVGYFRGHEDGCNKCWPDADKVIFEMDQLVKQILQEEQQQDQPTK